MQLFTFLSKMPSKDLPQNEEIAKIVFDNVVIDVINSEKDISEVKINHNRQLILI